MKNSDKKLATLMLILASLNSCSNKQQETVSSYNIGLPIMGGAVTKEIIIRTNQNLLSPNGNLSISGTSNKNTSNDNFNTESNAVIKKINDARAIGISSIKKDAKNEAIIKPEYLIDLGAGALTAVGAFSMAPVSAAATALGIAFGDSALKGFIQDKRNNYLEESVAKLTDRRDRDILMFAISEANSRGDQFLNDINAGMDSSVVKEKIKKYQQSILENTGLTPSQFETFLQTSNDNFLLGIALKIKDDNSSNIKDTKLMAKNLNENNKLLTDIAKYTSELIEKQNQVLEEINKKFNPDEKEIFMSALFDSTEVKSRKDALLNPEQLNFFKSHPDKLNTYKIFLKNHSADTLINIVNIQESAQASMQYMQVSLQIANNLNLNPEVSGALNTVGNLSATTTSLSSFIITSNPLDALNAISSLTSIFSKPKADPRFTAIFENFRNIQQSLNQINNHLNEIDTRLDNLDDGLNYIVNQNQSLTDLILEEITSGQYKCAAVTDIIKNIPSEKLTYSELSSVLKNNQEGGLLKLDTCLKYLDDTFEDPFIRKRVLFSNKLRPEADIENLEVAKYYKSKNTLEEIYRSQISMMPLLSQKSYFWPENLLNIDTVITHTNQLIANSFLFDFSRMNNSNNWELVPQTEVAAAISKNKNSDLLLQNALKLVEVAIVQQSVIDGTVDNAEVLDHFMFQANVNCAALKDQDLSCLTNRNSILRTNLVTRAFRKLIGHDYYWAWNEVSKNNPDWLNDKLANTSMKIVWVGAGYSDLYQGDKLPESNKYKNGAYIRVVNNDKLIPMPQIETLDEKSSLLISDRVKLLMQYKSIIENELLERHIADVLSVNELAFYNNEKMKQVLQ